MPEKCLLIGDIGGTNARFAIANNARPGFARERSLRCVDFDSAELAIREYLKRARAPQPTAICLAAAGPVVDGSVRFTNNPWRINASDLGRAFGPAPVRLLNDFEAIAYSIPFLQAGDTVQIGLPPAADLGKADYTIGILGPGTGLGAVGLIRRDLRLFPIVGEAGHIGFAPQSQVQMDILTALRERFDRVSVERLVSGPGLENIYWALTRIHDEDRTPLTAAEIFAAGIANEDPRAAEAVQMFFETLGNVAGDLALLLGAADGIYIAGGIARRYPRELESSRFRSGFESKGRHRSLMERIPTQLVTYEQPGLLGAAYCALQMSADPSVGF